MLAVQKFCAKLHVPIEKKIEHNKPQFFKRFIIFKNTYIFCYFSTVPHNPGIPIIHVLLFFRTKDLWKSVEKLDGLAVEVLSLWQQKEIDVIIAPGFTFPAPPVKHPARLVPALSYTAAYNVLDFPVGSVPITRVIPQDEVCQYLLN